ncbi:MAG TPA: hypothetical protein PKD79_01595 [Candidatus Doudnabacteria bacterium]|nr:hypothetical protein [Candidatus Doudnabacteria bacterium]
MPNVNNTPNNGDTHSVSFDQAFKLVVLVAALLALLYVAIWLSDVTPKPSSRTVTPQEDTTENATVTARMIPDNMLPQGFPDNFPVESGAEVKENVILNVDNQGDQATRTFTSSQSMTANYTLYSNYLRNNGWEIMTQINEANYKMVLGKKGFQLLQVNINPSDVSGSSVVRATVTDL